MTNVLIVDDSPTLRHLIRTILNADPELNVIGEARNGEEAVSMVARLRPDVVTMDIQMPTMDGYEAIRRIMSENPVPIVVLTSTESPECPNVSVDAGNIQQVFLNLIGNAVDAVKNSETRNIDIQIDRDSDQPVMVRVADTGCGIPKEIQEKIFDPFYTTKGVGKGTGLGLSASRGIVEKAGGSIEFDSEPEKGTVFTVRLPA